MSEPEALATPCLLVDLDVVEANLAEMSTLADDLGVTLRPHAKTHKSSALARRQLDSGAVGLTVATVAEAESFAATGFEDLFVAYPLWVDAAKGRRIRDLMNRARVTIGIDSRAGAQALAAQLGRDAGGVRVLVEVDSGQHRSGIPAEDAADLAEVAGHGGLDVAGVFTFPGHAYAPALQADVAAEEADALARAADGLRGRGLATRVVSGGSTPTAARTGPGMTELRPGVYVFGDAQQWELGTTTPDRIGLTCLATVVSHAHDRVVLDAGSKALGADRLPWATGFGRLVDHPLARIVLLGEHHAVVEWGSTPPPRSAPGPGSCPIMSAPPSTSTTRSSWSAAARSSTTGRSTPAAPTREGTTMPPAPPDLVIFDCDGVLVDTERLTVAVEARVLTELGWPLTAEDVVRQWMGRSSASQLAEVEAHLGRAAMLEFDQRTTREVEEAFTRELRAVDGVDTLVTALHHARVPTCVASSGSHARMRRTLGTTGLYEAFRGRIYSATEVEHGKPAPDLFLHAADQMGVDPARCAVVEDSVYGVRAARAAGMTAYGFGAGLTGADDLAREGAVVFHEMAELVEVLAHSSWSSA